VVRKGGHIALVVGNAQYHGIAVPVDDLVADIGRQAGLSDAQIILLCHSADGFNRAAFCFR
jgi:hypothetical protein